MPTSSGTYSFQSISAELLIREAFDCIGIAGSFVVAEQLDSAKRSINFLLADWANKNMNLWTIKQSLVTLVPGLKNYTLPIQTQKVIQVEIRTSIRQKTGIAFASSGVAQNAFDDNPKTFWVPENENNNFIGFEYRLQDTVNPAIYHDFPRTIKFLGIQSESAKTYTLELEGSNTGLDGDYKKILTISSAAFAEGELKWFELDNANSYIYYRLKQTADDKPEIKELYFNDTIRDGTTTEISQYEYLSYPDKNSMGRPTVYTVNYQIIPTLTLWQVPDDRYKCMIISYQSAIETLTSYTESINIPSAFYQALIFGLAVKLAIKYAPDKVDLMGMQYESAMQAAVLKNTTELTLNVRVYAN